MTRDDLLDELAAARARLRPALDYVADLEAQLASLDGRGPERDQLIRTPRGRATPPG
jgi:hypothetical protein